MKNIHILPTDKPSRLRITSKGKLILSTIAVGSKGETQHIYITNDEEIKEGDWVIFNELEIVKCTYSKNGEFLFSKPLISSSNHHFSYFKKIILTTDQDLIKDGVQAIDDEFLEWFVNNPSCEEVEVESYYKVKSGTIQEHKKGVAGYEYYEYKIIIPKEEQTKCYCGHTTTCDCGPETLEEVAKIWVHNRFTKQIKDEDIYASESSIVQSHILFAKWQQERSYSEEEVLAILNELGWGVYVCYSGNTPISEWMLNAFEQFKKK